MKFCVRHFLKILFILSLGLGLNGIAKSSKSFTKNLHKTSESTQNQFLLDIEEEEIEEEVEQIEPNLSSILIEVPLFSINSPFVLDKSHFAGYLIRFDIIKAYQIANYLAFHNLRL